MTYEQDGTLRLEPIEGVLAILDHGSVTGTNKYGLLLALLDVAPGCSTDGVIEASTLAERCNDRLGSRDLGTELALRLTSCTGLALSPPSQNGLLSGACSPNTAGVLSASLTAAISAPDSTTSTTS